MTPSNQPHNLIPRPVKRGPRAVHRVRDPRGPDQPLHVGDLRTDGGGGRSQGDEAEVRDAVRGGLEGGAGGGRGGHGGLVGEWKEGGEGEEFRAGFW